MIPWVGVVGGIGAGKSALCRIWAGLGVPTLDLDELGRLLWNEPEVRKALSALFPEAVRNGRLDRKAVARLAFAARKRLRALEAVLHPRIWEEAVRWRMRAQGAYAAVEASALLESGAEAKMDAVVAVVAPWRVRWARLKSREMDPRLVRGIVRAQVDDGARVRAADFVLVNDAGWQALEASAISLHQALVKRFARQNG